MSKDDSEERDFVSSSTFHESKTELYVERALELFREGWRAHWVWRYGFAVLLVAAVVLARRELGLPPGVIGRFVTFYPAMLLVADLGGMGAGIVATVLTAVCVLNGVYEPGGEDYGRKPRDGDSDRHKPGKADWERFFGVFHRAEESAGGL